MQAPPPSSAGARQPEGQQAPRWKVELPSGTAGDDQFGGCRTVEQSYIKNKQIGEGTYGQVYLANDKQTGEEVALKKIRMDNEKEGFPITAIREIKLLKNLDHENVIRLKEIVRSQSHKCNNFKGSIYMVFDYMDHDLTGLMERKAYKFKPEHVKCYMRQLLAGLAYCHRSNVLHRDLKASNLLINNSGILKLADFGLARKYASTDKNERYTNRVITLWYRPPELLLGSEHYGPEIDMWSVGCIFAELLVGKPVFPGKEESDQMDRIGKLLGTPNEENMPSCSKLPWHNIIKQNYKHNKLRQHFEQYGKLLTPGAIDLLEKMLCLDPKKRVDAITAFGDPYLWKLPPMPCEPSALPKYDASHELDMKKKRHAEREQRQAQGGGGAQHGAHPDAKRPRYGGAGPGPAPGQPQSGQPGRPGAYPHPGGPAHHREPPPRFGGGGGLPPPAPAAAARGMPPPGMGARPGYPPAQAPGGALPLGPSRGGLPDGYGGAAGASRAGAPGVAVPAGARAPAPAPGGYGAAPYGGAPGAPGAGGSGYLGAGAMPYGGALPMAGYPAYGGDAGYYAGQAAGYPAQPQSGYSMGPAGARAPPPRPGFGAAAPPNAMAAWQKQRR